MNSTFYSKTLLPTTLMVIFTVASPTFDMVISAQAAVEENGDHVESTQINIHRKKISPAVVIIKEGEAVVWKNKTEHLAQIILSDNTIDRISCRDTSNVIVDAEKIKSLPFRGNDFVSTCTFPKGRYEYQVGMADVGPNAGTRRKLTGTLVVE